MELKLLPDTTGSYDNKNLCDYMCSRNIYSLAFSSFLTMLASLAAMTYFFQRAVITDLLNTGLSLSVSSVTTQETFRFVS